MGSAVDVLHPHTPPNRLLRAGLATVAVVSTLWSLVQLAGHYAGGVDAIIPLRAAERWAAGGEPYLASAFAAGPGYDLPFLYPPPVLVLVAPLLVLPPAVVVVLWMSVVLLAAAAAAVRLGIPWRWLIVVLAWPPFAEAILGGNAQTVLFLAFVLLYVGPHRRDRPWAPVPHDPRVSTRPAPVDGILAALIASLKLSQAYAWANLLRRRPSAALSGAAIVALIALATLPIVGIEVWRAWLDQLAGAADPSWVLAGAGLDAVLPGWVRPVIVITGLVLAFLAPADDAGASVGAIMVVLGQSLRMFGVLFLVPAMLRVRREIALVAAALVASYTLVGLWSAIAIVVASLVAARRWDVFLEPDRDRDAAVNAPAPA